MQPFTRHTVIAAPLLFDNIDTDQIIPARFLRRAKSDSDYHRYLFHDLRFDADGNEKDFVFNNAAHRGGKILVSDINWGCGSSRENAVDALDANGIRSVIAPSFGDIHYSNCIQNGLLPIRLSAKDCATLRTQLRESPGAEIAIDLETQSLTGPDQTSYSFEIKEFDKYRLMNGLSDVELTAEFKDEINAFESAYKAENAWAY